MKNVVNTTQQENTKRDTCGKVIFVSLVKNVVNASQQEKYPPVHIQVDIDYLLIFLSRIPLMKFSQLFPPLGKTLFRCNKAEEQIRAFL